MKRNETHRNDDQRARNRHQDHPAGRRADLGYITHGARRDTVNQFENPGRGLQVTMVLLIGGEIGGFGVLLAGFVAGQFL